MGMDCTFCSKEMRFEPIRKGYSNLIQIWRCPDCSAQFIYSTREEKIGNVTFFRDIKEHPFSIQIIYPWVDGLGRVIVRRHDGKFTSTNSEVLELPFIDGLKPENAAKKLRTWLIFS